ncbi:MAG: NAD(P)-dependent oxidoreductase [Intestinibacter sp.]
MNVTIFGANGSIGKHLINFFVKEDHKVIAFVDKPGSIKIPPSNLKIIVGHAYDHALVRNAIKDADVVINAFKPDFKLLKNTNYYVNNISNKTIIEEMIKLNKKRFITLSRLTNNIDTGNINPFIWEFLNKIQYKSYKKEFKSTLELLEKSDLDWTILRIIRTFPSRKKGQYSYYKEKNSKLSPFISNYNIAYFLYDISVNNLFINEMPIISNKKSKK